MKSKAIARIMSRRMIIENSNLKLISARSYHNHTTSQEGAGATAPVLLNIPLHLNVVQHLPHKFYLVVFAAPKTSANTQHNGLLCYQRRNA
jgi:hypothetical protein